MGGDPRRLAARGAPGLVRALRSLLPLARARPLGVRGHRGGDPAPAHDRRPGGASLPGLPQALALHLVRDERSLQVNWAALDFGALVCRPRRPLCPCCPLRSACAYALLLEPPATPSAG